MKPQDKNIEDLFRSAFENASLEPPHKEEMWTHIQSAVQKPPVSLWRTKRFRVSSIAASIALLIGLLYYSHQDNAVSSADKKANEAVVSSPLVENWVSSDEQTLREKNTSLEKGNENELKTEKNNKVEKKQDSESDKKSDRNDNNIVLKSKSAKSNSNDVLKDELENENELSTLLENIDNPTTPKEEKMLAKTYLEVKEIVSIANPQIIIPFALDNQPVLQLVKVVPVVLQAGKEEKAENEWWIGFTGFYNHYTPNIIVTSPDLPTSLLKFSTTRNFTDCTNVAKAIRDDIQVSPSITMGIDIGKLVGKNWFFRSGISFTNFRYSFNSPILEKPSTSSAQSRAIRYENVTSNTTSQIVIPVQFGYQSFSKSNLLDWFVAGGFTSDILLNNSLTPTYSEVTYDFGTYKSLNISFTGSAGLLYHVTPKFSTLLELNYRRTTSSVYDSPNLTSQPHWIGVGLGARLKF
ncbi:MAG: hypothetical protein OHK0057_36460 [Thermoflexibacter sp.]